VRDLNKHEASFIEWATAQGWRVTKQGWPDFMCRRGAEIMAVEVKGGNDWVRPEQAQTMDDLRAAGLPTFVWWPERGLLSGNGTTESIVTMMADNARLMRTLAETIGLREKMQTTRGLASSFLSDLDPRMRALVVVSNRCIETHSEHRQWDAPQTSGFAFCGWLLHLSFSLSMREMVEVTGLSEKQIGHILPRIQRLAQRTMAEEVDTA